MSMDTDGLPKLDNVIFGEIQVLLAEKRTALASLRTGIAVFALPLSVLSALIATSRYYSMEKVMPLLLPLTFGLEPTIGIIMLTGIFYGAMYGGSTTSILVRIPGEAASVVTCIDGYEMARRAAVWNARTPERFPDRIVVADDEADVVEAVRAARAGGMSVGVRSGGHSWAGNHVRDGGLLLDLSRLDAIEIDADAMTAAVGPACRGDVLVAALAERDLFFPAGHCPGVGLGSSQGGHVPLGHLRRVSLLSLDGQPAHTTR